MSRSSKLPTDQYFSLAKIPEDWFLPVSELNSDRCKEYMDESGRKQTLKATLEAMVEEKKKERKKK